MDTIAVIYLSGILAYLMMSFIYIYVDFKHGVGVSLYGATLILLFGIMSWIGFAAILSSFMEEYGKKIMVIPGRDPHEEKASVPSSLDTM